MIAKMIGAAVEDRQGILKSRKWKTGYFIPFIPLAMSLPALDTIAGYNFLRSPGFLV
jgi:hypothetical protein